ncbi:hypothetical protein EAO76_30335 [Streptomyces sp. sk2.1]|nr:hypothetical protein EAO76_30335 [Streptomyces sp. sk2.1]
MRTITADTTRFVPRIVESTATAAVRSVKFCVRAAHTRVTQKYDGCTAQRARKGCVRSQIWEAA